jgi:hypothetical protein
MIYTFDVDVFLLNPAVCIYDNIAYADEKNLDRPLSTNEIIVIFYESYKFKRNKELFDKLMASPQFKKTKYRDGVILSAM